MMSHYLFLLTAAQGAGGAPKWLEFVPMIVIFAVFIFIIFRSQKKEKQRRDDMLSGVKVGDRLITTGGIYATVTAVNDRSLIVKIAENVKVELSRSGVATLVDDKADGKEEPKK